MEWFTVDRLGSLRPGTVGLHRWSDVNPPELQAHVHELFPHGVSRHGERYLLRPDAAGLAVAPNIELLWEYTRRAVTPAAPSRFQSLFAFETLTSTRRFQSEFCGGSGTIWRLQTDHVGFRADLRWLTLRGSALEVSHAATSYWRQASTADLPLQLSPREPLWEVLLRPPVQVIAPA